LFPLVAELKVTVKLVPAQAVVGETVTEVTCPRLFWGTSTAKNKTLDIIGKKHLKDV